MFKPDFIYNRDAESSKSDYGHALLIAGSFGKMGAAVLAAKACLRSGVGLLTVHVPRCGVGIMQTAVPEAMVTVDDSDTCFTTPPQSLGRYDAIAIGPGLGTDNKTVNALFSLLRTLYHKKEFHVSRLVLDADALNIIASHPAEMHYIEDAVITPHEREYGRLFSDADPQAMADTHNIVIVKKAHNTMIYAPGCEPVTNHTGNPGMATAGSGDVLSGIMLGLSAQTVAYSRRHPESEMSLRDVAAFAVEVHGRAGDVAASRRCEASMVASDIIEALYE